MRSFQLFAGLVLLPVIALSAPIATADTGGFCLNGSVNGSEQSINCGSTWVAIDGTRLGPVPDPRNTPRTPYRGPNSVWSGSSASSATYSSGSTGVSAPIWQSPAPAQYPTHTNTVTHGVYYQQPTTTHNNWSTATHLPPSTSCAPINPTCGSQQTTYRSHNITSGCFSYDAHGQARSVPCPANVTHTNTWTHNQQQYMPVTILQQTASAHAAVDIVENNGFFNSLNGGVGSGSNVYYGGGGGGYFISGGSSRVFSQAPLLRMPNKNIGNRRAPKKNYHGGGGGGKGGHKGGH